MTTLQPNTPGGAAQPASAEAELKLPRPPGVFRRWLAAHPKAVDWTIVGTYLFGCAMMALFALAIGISSDSFAAAEDDVVTEALGVQAPMTSFITWPWLLVSVAITALIAIALLYRRKYPLAGVILVALLSFLEQGLLGLPNSVALVFLLYAVPVYRSVRAGWIGYGIASLCGLGVFLSANELGAGAVGPAGFFAASQTFDVRQAFPLAFMNSLWLLATLMIGINFGNRRRYVEALIDRAHQLAREREQRAQLAVAEERSRIAREMHDIVAHSLSVVVTLSEAASVAIDSQPQAAKNAMERAAETGRSALVEMRRLLGVLYADDAEESAAPRAPQPGAAELHELVAGFAQAGLRIDTTEQGTPSGDATQQLAVYRIVQEGLTNALRYAGRGAEVRVVIENSPSRTVIEVVDVPTASHRSGRSAVGEDPAVPRAQIPGSGRGIAGARERARMFGGTLEAGPYGTGWRIRAEIPVQGETE